MGYPEEYRTLILEPHEIAVTRTALLLLLGHLSSGAVDAANRCIIEKLLDGALSHWGDEDEEGE